MSEGPNIVRIAALIGDNARAEVLSALMAGGALTATELADMAGVTKPCARRGSVTTISPANWACWRTRKCCARACSKYARKGHGSLSTVASGFAI